MRISNSKLRIEFDRFTIRMLSLAVDDSSRLERYSQTVPCNCILRIELHGTACKHLRVGKSFRVVAGGPWLYQDRTQRDLCVGFKGRPRNAIAIRGFGIVPALLLAVYVAQTIRSASVACPQSQYLLVSGSGARDPPRIAGLVTLLEQICDPLRDGWSNARVTCRSVTWFRGRIRLRCLLLGLRVLSAEDRSANIYADILRQRSGNASG